MIEMFAITVSSVWLDILHKDHQNLASSSLQSLAISFLIQGLESLPATALKHLSLQIHPTYCCPSSPLSTILLRLSSRITSAVKSSLILPGEAEHLLFLSTSVRSPKDFCNPEWHAICNYSFHPFLTPLPHQTVFLRSKNSVLFISAYLIPTMECGTW